MKKLMTLFMVFLLCGCVSNPTVDETASNDLNEELNSANKIIKSLEEQMADKDELISTLRDRCEALESEIEILELEVVVNNESSSNEVPNKSENEEMIAESETDNGDYSYVGTFINGDEIYIEEYMYHLQEAAWNMIILRDGLIYKQFEGRPSKPKFNEDRTQILFIDNLQFEVVGNVVVYDAIEEKEMVLTDVLEINETLTVKDAEWYDNEKSVLCILGFNNGTVTQGGDLYKLNLEDLQINRIDISETRAKWTSKPNEIVDIYVNEDEVEITLIQWIDDSYMDYYYTIHQLGDI